MPTATNGKAKAKRETWRDWLPPSAPDPSNLLTTSQLIAELHRIKIDVDAGDVRFWVQRDILPGPVRRWHRGKNQGLYHPAYVPAIRQIRYLQAHGLKLDQLRPQVRRFLAEYLVSSANLPPDARIAAVLAIGSKDDAPQLPSDIEAGLREWAAVRERITEVPTREISVTVVTADGKKVTYTITPTPPDGQPLVRAIV
jgi:DNA-binding transcriptional MerR regulator